MITIDDLLNMSLQDLEKTERQLRLGGKMRCPSPVHSSGTVKYRHSMHPSGGVSVSTRNGDANIVLKETETLMLPPKRADHRLSDQFAPIRLEDIDTIDMSLMQAFFSAAAAAPSFPHQPAESEWFSEPTEGMRRGSDMNGEFSDFVMSMLAECEGARGFEGSTASHLNALFKSCVE